eukprot:scaffold5412_cov36-Attheya_sp.AAC.1
MRNCAISTSFYSNSREVMWVYKYGASEDGEKKHDTTNEAKTRRMPTQVEQSLQQRDSGSSIRAVHCLYRWGQWSKAGRAADCHFERVRFELILVRLEIYVQNGANCFSVCWYLLYVG